MKKPIITTIFLIIWISTAYYVSLKPQLLSPLTKYVQLSINELSIIYVVLMLILTILFSYMLIHQITNRIKKYIQPE